MKYLVLAIFMCAIHFSFAQNIGIGTINVAHAKLTVEGAVGPVVGLFKNGSGVSIGVSGNNENVGLNYADGKAIATGVGARLFLSNSTSTGGIGLQFYSSAPAGAGFPTAINVLRHIDNRWAGSGHWMDMLYDEPGRLRVTNQLYNKANGSMNLLPLGAIYFKVNNMHNGDNATVTVNNVGDGGSLLNSVQQMYCNPGSAVIGARMVLELDLDLITKDYDNIYIVGSPSFHADGEQVNTCSVKFSRRGFASEHDNITIRLEANRFWSSAEIFGTLLIYGNRTLK